MGPWRGGVGAAGSTHNGFKAAETASRRQLYRKQDLERDTPTGDGGSQLTDTLHITRRGGDFFLNQTNKQTNKQGGMGAP